MVTDFTNYQYFLIIDLEATCCDQQSIERGESEIIEIGAVLVDGESLAVVDEFMTFVKPIRHPKLTRFCTQLTSITQSDVDSAPQYPEAIDLLKGWLSQYNHFLFCSWGDYDKNQFEQDNLFHNVPSLFESQHLNIKNLFSSNQGLKKRLGMAKALKLANLSLGGTHHRGIDDARNMAKLMPFVLGRQTI